MTAPVTANKDKDTRAADCREYLRDTFVKKFEGYRPATSAEISAGTPPENYSFVQVGRGHSDRMNYKPFPEPIAPLTPLRASAYLNIEKALLLPPDDEHLPLVEYYRRNTAKEVTGVLAAAAEKGDLASVSATSFTDTDGNSATPPGVGEIRLYYSQSAYQTFFYDSVTRDSDGFWVFSLRAGQVNQYDYATTQNWSVRAISCGAIPWTREEIRKEAESEIGWSSTSTSPMFEKGFFLAATEKAFLLAILGRLLPTYLAYTPCTPKVNSLWRAYRYFVYDTGETVYLRIYAGSCGFVSGKPVYAEDTQEVWLPENTTMLTVDENDFANISQIRQWWSSSYHTITAGEIAKACVYTGGTSSIIQSNYGYATKGAPFIFPINCNLTGITILSRLQAHVIKCSATITGGWTAPCTGTLYLTYNSGLLHNVSNGLYEFEPFDYLHYGEQYRCYPRMHTSTHLAYLNGTYVGEVPSTNSNIGERGTPDKWIEIAVSGGDTVTFGTVENGDDGLTCQIIVDSDSGWSSLDGASISGFTCRQYERAVGIFVAADWRLIVRS